MPDTEPTEQNDAQPSESPPPYIISNPSSHTMLTSLFEYVRQKMHQDILSQEWNEIIVRGEYSRTPPRARLADCEKRDKLFNWHRPTATILGPGVLALNCFPGVDYTEHYASLVATYLALTGQNPALVKCQMPEPSRCREIFRTSNLKELGDVDVMVIGYVDQMRAVAGGEWQSGITRGSGGGDGVVFSWQKKTISGPDGKSKAVAYLASMPSFWGDISYHLVHALHEFNRPKCLVYLGKAGSLQAEILPNEWLVTGAGSLVRGELIEWGNVLERECQTSEVVALGNMVTVSSPLCESFDWLEENKGQASWVDCEVGHIAKACKETGTQFGYLHIVSDNVSGRHDENLANEQTSIVRIKRRKLFDEMQTILEGFLMRYDGEP